MNGCLVDGCNGKYEAKGYCSKHYIQFKTYGEIRKRTIQDPNEIILDGNICWIILYNKSCIEISRTKICAVHYDKIQEYNLKWHLNGNKYAVTTWRDESGHRHTFQLHEFIFYLLNRDVPIGYEIDHKDNDTLNNLDDNLRLCTSSQNKYNRRKSRNNTSGYKGVSWNKLAKKWSAQIMINYKPIYLGYFNNKDNAIRAYNEAAIKYHGEFAQLNSLQSL